MSTAQNDAGTRRIAVVTGGAGAGRQMPRTNFGRFMSSCRRASQIAATVLAVWVLLAEATTAPARAEITPTPVQNIQKATRDGWQLALKLENEFVNSVPNLAAAANSREAFVTLSATASAIGGSVPITDSTVVAGGESRSRRASLEQSSSPAPFPRSQTKRHRRHRCPAPRGIHRGDCSCRRFPARLMAT